MVPACGMVFVPQNPSTGNGQITGYRFILTNEWHHGWFSGVVGRGGTDRSKHGDLLPPTRLNGIVPSLPRPARASFAVLGAAVCCRAGSWIILSIHYDSYMIVDRSITLSRILALRPLAFVAALTAACRWHPRPTCEGGPRRSTAVCCPRLRAHPATYLH